MNKKMYMVLNMISWNNYYLAAEFDSLEEAAKYVENKIIEGESPAKYEIVRKFKFKTDVTLNFK